MYAEASNYRDEEWRDTESDDLANTKHSYNMCTTPAQRLRRWSNIVQMSYKCFVPAGEATGILSFGQTPG